MIAKAKSCIGGTALIGYVVNEKKGYELERNNVSGENPSELYRSMQVIQNQNLRCKNNTISVVLSPEKGDGKVLSPEQWREILAKFLKQLGLDKDKAQYIGFIHTEKEHKHLHLILNRVQDNGKLINDSFIGKRAQHIGHRIAKEMGLKSAKEIKQNREKEKKEFLKDVRERFRKVHEEVKALFPENLSEYSFMMKEHGIQINPFVNKQGLIQGFKVKMDEKGEEIKLSLIDRKIKLNTNFFTKLLTQKKQELKKLSKDKKPYRKQLKHLFKR